MAGLYLIRLWGGLVTVFKILKKLVVAQNRKRGVRGPPRQNVKFKVAEPLKFNSQDLSYRKIFNVSPNGFIRNVSVTFLMKPFGETLNIFLY